MFSLGRYYEREVTQTADITFYAQDTSKCLLACFDLDSCKVAVYDSNYDQCQIFTTQGIADLTKNENERSDVYYRTCECACHLR